MTTANNHIIAYILLKSCYKYDFIDNTTKKSIKKTPVVYRSIPLYFQVFNIGSAN
jgi:hypothetical protein